MHLFRTVIFFHPPPKSDIIVFDATNKHLVLSVIPDNLTTYIYSTSLLHIWVDFKVSIRFFKLLLKYPLLSQLKIYPGNWMKGFFRLCKYLYVESCLINMNPKGVITYIDNSGLFSWLSANCTVFPFFSIQNGGRLSYAATSSEAYHSQHLFCFGEHEERLFPQIGYKVENFYPCGSLSASLYFNISVEKEGEHKFDLLIVSTWRGNIGFPKDVEDTMRAMKIMDQLLAKYIRLRGIQAAVILRAEKDSEHWFMPEIEMNEEEYYKSIYGECIEIMYNDFSKRPIYTLMKQSQMIVSCLSTAILEGFGFGKKALYYNFCGTDFYHKDFSSDIVSTQTDEVFFNKELDSILNMPPDEYTSKYGTLQKYYMNFPADKPTQQYISGKILEIINNP